MGVGVGVRVRVRLKVRVRVRAGARVRASAPFGSGVWKVGWRRPPPLEGRARSSSEGRRPPLAARISERRSSRTPDDASLGRPLAPLSGVAACDDDGRRMMACEDEELSQPAAWPPCWPCVSPRRARSDSRRSFISTSAPFIRCMRRSCTASITACCACSALAASASLGASFADEGDPVSRYCRRASLSRRLSVARCRCMVAVSCWMLSRSDSSEADFSSAQRMRSSASRSSSVSKETRKSSAMTTRGATRGAATLAANREEERGARGRAATRAEPKLCSTFQQVFDLPRGLRSSVQGAALVCCVELELWEGVKNW